jgi:hypothetical protein
MPAALDSARFNDAISQIVLFDDSLDLEGATSINDGSDHAFSSAIEVPQRGCLFSRGL